MENLAGTIADNYISSLVDFIQINFVFELIFRSCSFIFVEIEELSWYYVNVKPFLNNQYKRDCGCLKT